MTSSPSRLISIDYTRAFAIILVVAGHCGTLPCPQWWINCVKFIYTFHMPLFLAISGFLYMHTRKQRPYFQFILGKFHRLLIPYFFTSILIISIKLISQKGMYVENGVTLYSYIECLYSPAAGYFLWFMWALWWMFVIIPWFNTRLSKLFLFLIALILHFTPEISINVFCISQTLKMMVYFVAGAVVYDWRQILLPIYNSPRNIFILTAVFILSEICYFYGMAIFDIISALSSIILFPSIFKCLENSISQRWHKYLMLISSTSFIIYLFQTTVTGFIKSLLWPILQTPSHVVYALYIITAIILSTIGCILLAKILSKNALTRWIFAIPSKL